MGNNNPKSSPKEMSTLVYASCLFAVITGPLAVRKAEEERPEAKNVITIIKHKATPEEADEAIIRTWRSLPKVHST
jgi:hypothetical protein